MRLKLIIILCSVILYLVTNSLTVWANDPSIRIIDVPVWKTGEIEWYQGFQVKVVKKENDIFSVTIGKFSGSSQQVEVGVFDPRIIKIDDEDIEIIMVKVFDSTNQTTSYAARIVFNSPYRNMNENDLYLYYSKADYHCDRFGDSSPLCNKALIEAVSSFGNCLQLPGKAERGKYDPTINEKDIGSMIAFSIVIDSSDKASGKGILWNVGRIKDQKIYLQLKDTLPDCESEYGKIVDQLPVDPSN